jgi:hypothetical protein
MKSMPLPAKDVRNDEGEKVKGSASQTYKKRMSCDVVGANQRDNFHCRHADLEKSATSPFRARIVLGVSEDLNAQGQSKGSVAWV